VVRIGCFGLHEVLLSILAGALGIVSVGSNMRAVLAASFFIDAFSFELLM
jgi:hypothetical protein